MDKLPKKTSITLAVFHLPILVVIIAIASLAIGTFALNNGRVYPDKSISKVVLSDEDEREEESESEDSDKEDSSDDGGSEDRDAEESKEKDEKDEVKRTNTTNTQRVEIDDNEDELEDGDGKETNDELDDSEERVELVSTTTNPDGTITKTFKETDGSEIELRTLTYDQDGVLVKKAELNPDGTVKEEELVGKEDEGETEDINEEDDNDFELILEPSAGGTVNAPLSRTIKAKIKQEIKEKDGLGIDVSKIKLEVKTAQGAIKYEGTALKSEKLFGLFGVEVPVDLEIDPITGKIVSVNQTFWAKVFDFFSL